MRPDGSCPTCGRPIGAVAEAPRAPWHFKVLVGGVVAYLGWRLFQLVVWIVT
jgi:hypothetical protein